MIRILSLLLVLLMPACGWACNYYHDGTIATLVNLPSQVLVSAGSYSSGTVLYDSGKLAALGNNNAIMNCTGTITGRLAWDDSLVGSATSNNIYATSVPGIGIRVNVWLGITGYYDDQDHHNDFYPNNNEYHMGDVSIDLGHGYGIFKASNVSSNYRPTYQIQLIALGGKITNAASLTFNGFLGSVIVNDGRDGDLRVSRLQVTGTATINMTPMGCDVSASSLDFPMGKVSVGDFGSGKTAGSAEKSLTLTCEPGTNVSLRLSGERASGDDANGTVIALRPGTTTATGIGVQMNLNDEPLVINNSTVLYNSNRTVVSGGDGASTSYIVFTDPNNRGGAASSNELKFTANYYKTGGEITGGEANATGTLNFTYN